MGHRKNNRAGASGRAPGAGPGGMDRRTVVTASAVLAAGTLFAGGHDARARSARATGGVTVRLPAPTGPYPVGVTTLRLVDHHRRDPWNGSSVREVMVSVFYPARTVDGFPVAPQMTALTAAGFAAFDPVHVHKELPDSGVDWAATMTHSRTSAPARPVRRPVLLYSPGGADPRTVGTGLAEELAGHGCAVVTIDHPGEPGAVEFPDGRVRTYELPGIPTDPQVYRTMLGTRSADAQFVLDQLTALAAGRNPDADASPLPRDLGRALDLRRVGMYGHSAGGAAAAQTMYEDRRIGAAVNLEGYLDWPPDGPGQEGELLPVARHGVDRPLSLFGTDGFRDARIVRTWSAMLAHPGGRTRRRQLDGASHGVFTDYAAMAPQLQAAGLMSAAERIALVGAIDPADSVPRVRDHVRTFFARHLPPR
ncbi:alpha/beta hydrolase [Streptomyces yaizuensis]|uniref:Alpha/beta hydrolase n=1 Tax=Streptomyces yaizuensis TaxID=2989713 RepID=A0ABQ5NXG6_9ACTN|nr:alpha/beta hydrolase [Streptomyces sp. YSPA8]GLF94927.1 alpha/beta hydrolase [Streptomyces sp. YSPA8]